MTSNQQVHAYIPIVPKIKSRKVYKNIIPTATDANQEENRETSLPHVWPDTEPEQTRHAGKVCSTNASFV